MISIICPSPKGKEIAFKLKESLNAKLYIKEKDKCFSAYDEKSKYDNTIKYNEKCEQQNVISQGEKSKQANVIKYGADFKLNDVAEEAMKTSTGLIFISSTGIAVRAIAPFLKGKDKDPGVVVVDLSSRFAINILSGHLGGGNELTKAVSEILNAEAVITTATDNMGIIAPDVLAKNNDLIIEHLKKAKYIAVCLVDGREVYLKDDYDMVEIKKGYVKTEELKEDCIWITHSIKEENTERNLDYSRILRLINKDIVLGIGCKKNTPFEKLKEFICDSLEKFNLDKKSVLRIVSVDIKAGEQGIIDLSQFLNCPFDTFTRDEIRTVHDKFEKSPFVMKTLGIGGVCEPCVDLAGATIMHSKIKHDGMTLAIGMVARQNITKENKR